MKTIENDSLTQEVLALQRMTAGQLKEKWREVFGEAPRSNNRAWLWKRLAWQVQANALGGIAERVKQRARELVDESQVRVRPPKGFVDELRNEPATPRRKDRRLPPPGSVLIREYRGHDITVTVREKGFEYAGVTYRSLSAVARAVTGTNWNGYLFFGLNGTAKRKPS